MNDTCVRLTLALSLVLFAVLTGGCASSPGAGAASGSEADALRVGISTNYPPLAFRDNGEIVGVEADLAVRLGQLTGREVRLVETPWEDLIPALTAGKIDVIMAGMSATDERRRAVLFTEPYLRVGQMALIRTRDAARLAGPLGVYASGLRVGYEAGTTGEALVRSNLTGASPVAFRGVDAGIDALRRGAIDVYIHDAPTIWKVGNDPGERELIGVFRPLTEEHLAWAVRKTDTALAAQLNAALATMKEDGSLQAIVNRWIPVSVNIK